MGVLAKLFRKSSTKNQGIRSGARPRGGAVNRPDPQPSIVLEAKPVAPESARSQGDQASRLREEVIKSLEPQTDHETSGSEREESAAGRTSREEARDVDLSSDADNELQSTTETGEETGDGSFDSQALTRKGRSPRSKQELIEELHRNYLEVLGLVRKLDGRLDEARGRSEALTEITEVYAKLAPLFESLPQQIREHTQALGADLRSAVTEEGSAARELLERIESAIVHVGTDIERSTNQQGRLVQTMAEFREGLTDLSKTSMAACEAVRDSEARAARRDEAMLNQLRQTRLWLIGLTIGLVSIGIGGLVLGLLAIRG